MTFSLKDGEKAGFTTGQLVAGTRISHILGFNPLDPDHLRTIPPENVIKFKSWNHKKNPSFSKP